MTNRNHSDRFIELACATNCAAADKEYMHALADARRLLNEKEEIAATNIVTSSVVGDYLSVTQMLNKIPELAKQSHQPRNWTPLLYLCFSRLLREAGESENTNSPHVADFIETARALLDHGADPNAHFMLGDERETCLYGACGVVNCGPLARLLLEHGANVDDDDASYHVAESQNTDCIAALFEHGMSDNHRTTVLSRKLDFDDLDGVRFILEQGVDPNAQGIWGKSAVHQAIMRGRTIEFLELLAQHDADFHAPRNDGETPLFLAATHGRNDVFDWLCIQGINENWDAKQRFLVACGLGDRTTAERLAQENATLVDSLSNDERRLISQAAKSGNLNAISLMLDMGFDIATQDHQGFSALHWAAWYGHVKLVEELVRRDAPLGLNNNYGGNVIDSAAWGYANSDGNVDHCEEIFKSLVDAGANIADVTPFPTGNDRVDRALRDLGIEG